MVAAGSRGHLRLADDADERRVAIARADSRTDAIGETLHLVGCLVTLAAPVMAIVGVMDPLHLEWQVAQALVSVALIGLRPQRPTVLLESSNTEQFVTGLLLRIRLADSTAEIVNAGHPPPFLLRQARADGRPSS